MQIIDNSKTSLWPYKRTNSYRISIICLYNVSMLSYFLKRINCRISIEM